MAKRMQYTLTDKQAAVRDAVRRMEPVHQHWRTLETLYRTGSSGELSQADAGRILAFPVPGAFLRTVNMLLPHLTLMVNSVAARDPKFVITPTGGDPEVVERNSAVARGILDYFWPRTDATSVLRDMTQDMVVLGNGFAKVGWAYTSTQLNRDGSDVALETADLVLSAQEVAGEFGLPVDEDTIREIVEGVALTEELVEEDEPYAEYVSPYDIFVPPDARRMNQVRWVAQRLRLPLEEVRENPMFNKAALDDLSADTGYADAGTISQYELSDTPLPEAFGYVTIYEFYDMRDRKLTVFSLNGDKALWDGEIPYAHRYPPFVHMRNYSDGGSTFWAFGDIENVAGLQLMINEIMVAEINDLKRVGNKYFINKRVLTPELAKALGENKPDQVIPVDLPPNVAMQEVLQPVQRLATPSDNYMMEDKLQGYVQRILGISDMQVGQVSVASRVPATAAAAVEGATTTRALEKLSSVEKASRELATRMLALCQQFLDEGKAIRIVGPDAPTWLSVSAEDIEGEFSIEAEGGSTQAVNPMTRARQGLEMLNVVVPALAAFGYDTNNALRTALSYMGLNPDHLLVRPQPAPQDPGMGGDPAMQAMPPEGMPPGMDPGMGMPADAGMPMMQDLAALGGPPVPGAGSGEMLL
jgi:hypothetical protein